MSDQPVEHSGHLHGKLLDDTRLCPLGSTELATVFWPNVDCPECIAALRQLGKLELEPDPAATAAGAIETAAALGIFEPARPIPMRGLVARLEAAALRRGWTRLAAWLGDFDERNLGK